VAKPLVVGISPEVAQQLTACVELVLAAGDPAITDAATTLFEQLQGRLLERRELTVIDNERVECGLSLEGSYVLERLRAILSSPAPAALKAKRIARVSHAIT
jgi:hypothetical protein